MKVRFEKFYEKNEKDNDDNKRKRIFIYIVILLIILLSLITSCSCSSNFLGKIGDLFRNEEDFNIDDGTNDREVIKNKELKFDNETAEMSISDSKMKLSFSYKNIDPDSFTCSTSNAEIATCYVSNNYVVIIPKSPGKVTVTLQTTTNGKTYEANADLTITDAKRSINLASKRGTINLAKTKYKNVAYQLIGLEGEISVSSSDNEIATAIASEGILKITALKTGSVTITLTLVYEGMTYTEKYALNVIYDKNNSPSGSGSSGSKDPDKPTNPNPDEPNKPVDPTHPNSKYEITLSKIYPDSNYYLEDYTKDNPYYLKYELTKDGIPVDEKISIQASENVTTEIVKINGEYFIKVTPKPGVKAKDTATITISSHDVSSTTTIDFKIHEYNILVNPEEYNLNYLENGGSKTFIIQTGNLFKEVFPTLSQEKDHMLLCSKDKNTCITIEVLDQYKEFISLEYDETSSTGTSSLPIKVVVKDKVLNEGIDGLETFVKISAMSYGEKLKINESEEKEIKIKLIRSQKLTIYASNSSIKGFFSNGTDKYEIPISSTDVIRLTDYVAYGILTEGSCMYYPLLRFDTKSDGTGTSYALEDVISGLTSDLTLYAIYKTELENITVNPQEMKLYLTDVDLFHNEEYFQKYGEDKVIYPGAQGSYILTLYNNTFDELVIKGLTLEEDTICIPNSGCLNMGYVIKYAAPEDKEYTYYYGSKTGYTILNQDTNVKNNYATNRNINKKEIDFASGITLPQGKGMEISLLWKWVDVDNVADTAVGNFAYQHNDKINDMYKLTLSIDFLKNTCKLP